jgi:CDP-diacylglycerol--glycerol-3-phosphate 3-phosphatidyltransferase
LQTGAIAWYLWPVPDPYDVVGPWLMGAAVVVTVVTGVDYVLQAMRLRRGADRTV